MAEKSTDEPSFYKGISWPDPDPQANINSIRIDDVTRLNATEVDRIFQVRTIEDIQKVVALAKSQNKRICVCGTKHSMGGHTIAKHGFSIDMKLIKHIELLQGANGSCNDSVGQEETCDKFLNTAFIKENNSTNICEEKLVRVGCGALWSDVIKFLNDFGYSPRTMQSYASFSVGGTISVNAHGITTDYALNESIVSFRIIDCNGNLVECKRDEHGACNELFKCAIGGYGLFGVIYDVVMKVSKNYLLEMDAIPVLVSDFTRIYEKVLFDKSIEIKLARIDVTKPEHIELYVFRRQSDLNMVSRLALQPKEISPLNRIIYKWLAPTLQDVRFFIERSTGVALDWDIESDRNQLMYETAEPLSKLYSPLFLMDDTFVLQEYFVPKDNFQAWMQKSTTIFLDLAKETSISLLNTTIRFVWKDSDSILPYAIGDKGSFAFVLYYRIHRTQAADKLLQDYCTRFISVTLMLNGTFYLPYRHHYSDEQLLQAYPNIKQFAELKEKYDPSGLFGNSWFDRYVKQFTSTKSSSTLTEGSTELAAKSLQFSAQPFVALRVASEKRTDSYHQLYKSKQLRQAFVDEFLVNTFNIENNKLLYRLIAREVWDPANKCDDDIYRRIKAALAKTDSSILSKASTTWKQISQLRSQKKEITREIVSIVGKLGLIGKIHNYVSIGDHGKLVQSLKKALRMKGSAVIVHDVMSNDIPAVLERGSSTPIGKFIGINYKFLLHDFLSEVASDCVELVTLNQGLHHFRQIDIIPFLKEVYRVLRPGGLFIVREHDACTGGASATSNTNIIPILDLAHSIFNAVTGVSIEDEATEIRAFRPILEWREIVESVGFNDTLLYEMQHGDVTKDEMMCFSKDSPLLLQHFEFEINTLRESTEALSEIPATPLAFPMLNTLSAKLPSFTLDIINQLLQNLLGSIPAATKLLNQVIMDNCSTGFKNVLSQVVQNFSSSTIEILERFIPLIKNIKLKSNLNTSNEIQMDTNFIPSELFLIAPALQQKVKNNTATMYEALAAGVIEDLQRAVTINPSTAEAQSKQEETQKEEEVISSKAEKQQKLQAELHLLYKAIPALFAPSVIDNFGLSYMAKRTVQTFLFNSESGESVVDGNKAITYMAGQLADKLDSPAEKQFFKALHSLKAVPVEPTLALLTDNYAIPTKRHPWCSLMLAILSSSKVYITRQMSWKLSYCGLGVINTMWQFASSSCQTDISGNKEIEELVKQVNTTTIYKTEMLENNFVDIENVAEIVSAEYGYESLTASYHNCTQLLKTKYLTNDGKLHLKGVSLNAELGITGYFGLADAIRKTAVGASRILRIQYYRYAEEVKAVEAKIATLLTKLNNTGAVKCLHPDDGHYTWFKLAEWMQVEITSIFANSMNHTPWYRFPFMKFIKLYFNVLWKEVMIVMDKYGMQQAIFSTAFATDFIPGIVMTYLFSQMQLLAIPVTLLGGESYDVESMVEQVIITIPCKTSTAATIQWKKIDNRIVGTEIVNGLYSLKIPTFKPFTEILLKIARANSKFRIIQISNQTEIQAKVEIPFQKHFTDLTREDTEAVQNFINKLDTMAGCKVMFSFKYPVDGNPHPENDSCCRSATVVSVCVKVAFLVSFIRTCDSLGFTVCQLYDWFC